MNRMKNSWAALELKAGSMPRTRPLDLVRCLAPDPLPPADNMALDDLLLEEPGWFVRLTRWDRPAVTIGRFQPWPDSDASDDSGFPRLHPVGQISPPAKTLPAVRRVTGGGAILHGEDLTLAIAGDCPSEIFPRRRPTEVAARISLILADLFDAPAASRSGQDREGAMKNIADCFLRRSPSDVVVTTRDGIIKAGGIALAFRNGRVLIEASLRRDLLVADPADDLARLTRLARSLGLEVADGEPENPLLSESWSQQVARRVEERFGNPAWNRR